MHVECLMTLARVYCDQVWAEAQKIANHPTEDGYHWVDLDHCRLVWLIKHGYIERYNVSTETRLRLSGKGVDSLYNSRLATETPQGTCENCGEHSAFCEAVEYWFDDSISMCPHCRGLDSEYIDRDKTMLGLPVPVQFYWDGNGWSIEGE